MKLKLILLFAAISSAVLGYCQTIAPNTDTEFCPNTDVTFTVTLPLVKENTTPTIISNTNTPFLISGPSNVTHTSTQTTFKFVGRFRDVNIAQGFRVGYLLPGSTTPIAANFDYKKIKSLLS